MFASFPFLPGSFIFILFGKIFNHEAVCVTRVNQILTCGIMDWILPWCDLCDHQIGPNILGKWQEVYKHFLPIYIFIRSILEVAWCTVSPIIIFKCLSHFLQPNDTRLLREQIMMWLYIWYDLSLHLACSKITNSQYQDQNKTKHMLIKSHVHTNFIYHNQNIFFPSQTLRTNALKCIIQLFGFKLRYTRHVYSCWYINKHIPWNS